MNWSRATMPTEMTAEDARLLALFKALGNPVRYRMVRYMVDHPQCITGELAAFADLAQSTASQHLAVLRDAGLVQGVVAGPATCYCLDLATLAWFRDRVNSLAEHLAAACCPSPGEPAPTHGAVARRGEPTHLTSQPRSDP
jgi:ArsR family transcriptional regulator, arsenate/arsenite/antimonite-responsive transcriptional repressor